MNSYKRRAEFLKLVCLLGSFGREDVRQTRQLRELMDKAARERDRRFFLLLARACAAAEVDEQFCEWQGREQEAPAALTEQWKRIWRGNPASLVKMFPGMNSSRSEVYRQRLRKKAGVASRRGRPKKS
jgi:hypothetical protein